jgi:hypothetical protein
LDTWPIEIVYKGDQKLAVGLDFFMPNGHIVLMTISGGDWKTEITSIVSQLKSPSAAFSTLDKENRQPWESCRRRFSHTVWS